MVRLPEKGIDVKFSSILGLAAGALAMTVSAEFAVSAEKEVTKFNLRAESASLLFSEIKKCRKTDISIDSFGEAQRIDDDRSKRRLASITVFVRDTCAGVDRVAAVGEVDLARAQFNVADGLRRATLMAKIPAKDYVDGENQIALQVQVAWTADGPRESFRDKTVTNDSQWVKIVSRFSGAERPALASFSIQSTKVNISGKQAQGFVSKLKSSTRVITEK